MGGFKAGTRQLQEVSMGPPTQSTEAEAYIIIWTKVTLNLPNLQQLCINI